jgi:hypothetical protein
MRGLVRKSTWVVPAISLAVLLAVGIAAFDDYGISWDERVQRQYGQEVFAFVTEGDQQLFMDRHRYYGPVFELLLYSLERAFGLEDSRDIYLLRHLVTFLAFWIGTVFFYLLCKHIFGSRMIALLGCLLLVLSPRIFAHAFYNSKDIPFLAVFIVGIYTLLRYLERPTVLRAVLHGIVCALLIDVRIVGVLLPALTLVFIGYEILRPGAGKNGGEGGAGRKGVRLGLTVGVYLIISLGLTVLFWPTLWRDPARNFIRVFEGMRNFPWEASVLYLGDYVWSTQLPWHYIPVWIAISIPVAVIGLFGAGIARSIRALLWPGGAEKMISRRIIVLALAWCFLPVGYSIASGAVLYDAWRHTFFVYPGIVIVALIGIVAVFGRLLPPGFEARGKPGLRRVLAWAIAILIAFDLGSVAVFMVRHHPHQNVYFNWFVGGAGGAQGRFEMDYWGLSYRKGLELVLANDSRGRIIVNVATAPGRYNADILLPQDRERLVFVTEPHKAEYYLTNFRWQHADRVPGRELYTVKVGGAKIMAVQRLR